MPRAQAPAPAPSPTASPAATTPLSPPALSTPRRHPPPRFRSLYAPTILAAASLLAVASLVPASVWARAAAGAGVGHASVRDAADVDEAVLGALVALRHLRRYWGAYAVLSTALYWLLSVKPSVYLVDFAVFEPPASWRVTKAQTLELIKLQGCYTPESIDFQAKLLERSGVGDATHWPPSIVQMVRAASGGGGSGRAVVGWQRVRGGAELFAV